MMKTRWCIVGAVAALWGSFTFRCLEAAGDETTGKSAASRNSTNQVDFQRDIQPILAEYCNRCHGVDATARQSGLRLDSRDGALRGGESGKPAIVPGKQEESELIRRLTSTDPDVVMPPAKEEKRPSPPQIDLLRKWVDSGAEYAKHWAFVPPAKPSVSSVPSDHPIDAIVAQKHASLGLTRSPRAIPRTLGRRLYLDLIGLPPSPQELVEFEIRGFDETVTALLASERFGEKWARHWLDVARYSDTNGYEKDLQREQWAWRDWVITALNRDMPYDRFVIEQIAGDLLPHATMDQFVATGFLRNSMINEEGAIVPEQFRMVEMFDRMDCIGKAVLGLTTQCAQCHSHKFDPITQDEYYGMFACLNNSYEAQSWVYSAEQRQKIAELQIAMKTVEEKVRQQRPEWQHEITAWERDVLSRIGQWMPLTAIEMGSVSGLNHPTQEPDLSFLMLGHTSNDVFIISKPDLKGVSAVRLEALPHGDLPQKGPGRSKTGTWGVTEVEVFVRVPNAKDWDKRKLVNPSADFSEPESKQADGKKSSGPVRFLVDGTDDTSWQANRIRGPRNQPAVAVVQFEQPLDLPEGTELKVAIRMTNMLGCMRLSLTKTPNAAALPVSYAAQLAMQVLPADRSASDHDAIFSAWRESLNDCQSLNAEVESLWKQYPVAKTSILHLEERKPKNIRATYRLDRGEWDRPVQPVEPHTPGALHVFPQSRRLDRLSFAQWLVDRQSPLAARVAVNRVWQAIFGRGLVETAEDFGTRAPTPEFRELLDWLSVDFMEHGWSHKHLIRTIVSSSTYQQSSHVSPAQLEADPRNVWLARGPRFRAEAEVVRDISLSLAGLMTHKLGGPSVIPPVPQNVLDFNFTYPAYWTPATGPDRYRRTLYGFRKRSMPDPVMSNFDAPNADFACARRVRSNTPLAALTGLNEIIFVEAAQGLALRILREGGATDPERADYAFQLCTARSPEPAETAVILDLLKARRQKLAEGWLNPREIATGDPSKLPDLPPKVTPQDAAAWTLVARVLLNLDETLTKN